MAFKPLSIFKMIKEVLQSLLADVGCLAFNIKANAKLQCSNAIFDSQGRRSSGWKCVRDVSPAGWYFY